jgi:hypothetical protein
MKPMHDELPVGLATLVSQLPLPWVTAAAQAGPGLKWLPIFAFAQGRVGMGLSPQGAWVQVHEQRVLPCIEGAALVSLLPLLEIPLEQVRALISAGLGRHGLPPAIGELFPFARVVASGLLSLSEYWTTLALQWVADGVRDATVQAALHTLSEDGPTQNVRHRARKLARHLPVKALKSGE